MSGQPPRDEPPDDVDARYRRASALDRSRPSDAVRSAVLAHAARVAAQTLRQNHATGPAPPHRWRPARFGALAAAALAALLFAPRLQLLQGPVFSSAPAPHQAHAEPPVTTAPAAPAQKPETLPQEIMLSKPAPAAGVAARRVHRPARAPQSPHAAAPAAAPTPEPAGPVNQSRMRAAAPAPGLVAGRPGGMAARSSQAPATLGRLEDALREAAGNGDVVRLQLLLRTPVDIESRDAAGRTALMLATLRGQTATVEVLLAHGADPEGRDAQGMTPLQAAAAGDASGIAAALRRAGARD